MCGAKYRQAGTLALRLEKNTETISGQEGHLPFFKSAWHFDICSCRPFCPKYFSSEQRRVSPEGVVVAQLGSFSSLAGSQVPGSLCSLNELVKHGENGLVFKDAEELAAQLQVVGLLPVGLGTLKPGIEPAP